MDKIIEAMRRDGWMIAVHNDYRLNGVPHTFYLFTHPCGVWAKGEGTSDVEAICEASAQAEARKKQAKAAGLWSAKE